jgi:hypothetical protein
MLERVLLMMKYDSSKTLTENSDVVKNEFSQILNEALRIPKGTKVKATKSTKAPAPLKPPPGMTLKQAESLGNYKANYTAQYGKPPSKAELKAFKSNGYKAPTTAPAPAPPAKAPGKSGTVSANAPAGYKLTATPVSTRKRGSRNATPKDKSILSKARTWAGKNPWKVVGGLGLTAAGAWYFLRDNTSISACLLDSLTEEEQANIAAGGGTTGQLTRNTVGNKVADLNGGVVFNMDNNELVTGNGKFKGTYSCEGNGIKISIDGAEPFVVGGGGGADTGTSGGGTSGGGGGSRYKQCAETFPIAMNCKNSTIARVQGCIGVTQDGAFGPKTSAALVAKGADGSSITQASVDKVCGPGAAAKIEKLGQDVDVEDMGGNNTSNNVNIKSSDSSEDGIGG